MTCFRGLLGDADRLNMLPVPAAAAPTLEPGTAAVDMPAAGLAAAAAVPAWRCDPSSSSSSSLMIATARLARHACSVEATA